MSKGKTKILETRQPRERGFLIGISIGGRDKELVDDHLTELTLLSDTAGVEVCGSTVQHLKRPDPSTFMGSGKLAEIASTLTERNVDVVIFDDDLSPAQARNIEKILKCKTIDRSALILDIFAKRARTKEASTQVELAQLEYLLPRLRHYWTHLERQAGGGVFTKGPGETQLETDRRLIGDRIILLKAALKKIDRQRKTQRASRSNMFKVALVGYTNAGKSTLLNALADANVYTEDRLFATLDTTVRQVYLNPEYSALVSDTVGFIRKLPHNLVASFRSTLSEVLDADLLLHLVDAGSRACEEQIDTVYKVLEELGASQKQQLLVFNKVDLLHDADRTSRLSAEYHEGVFISAQRRIGLDALKQRIIEIINQDFVEAKISLDVSNGKLYSMIHHLGEVLEESVVDNKMKITYKAHADDVEKIRNLQMKQAEQALFDD